MGSELLGMVGPARDWTVLPLPGRVRDSNLRQPGRACRSAKVGAHVLLLARIPARGAGPDVHDWPRPRADEEGVMVDLFLGS